MNTTVVAMRAVDAAAHKMADAEISHELAMENQRGVRESSQEHKNRMLSDDLAARISEATKDIEQLGDTREVKLTQIVSKADDAIQEVSTRIGKLMAQLEEDQARLKRHETAKVKLMTQARDYYAAQIEIAQGRKALAEQAASGLAKPVQ